MGKDNETTTDKVRQVVEHLKKTDNDSSGKITKQTWLPLGLVVSIVAGAITFAVWIVRLQFEHEVVRQELQRQTEDRLKGKEFKEWLRLFKALNAGKDIDIPDM